MIGSARSLILALTLAALVAACGQPGAGAPTAAPSVATTAVVVKDFTLDPKAVTVDSTAGLAVTNEGPTVHNVAVRDAGGSVVATTRDLREGENDILAISLPVGEYALICTLPGHESLGIKGTLTVR